MLCLIVEVQVIIIALEMPLLWAIIKCYLPPKSLLLPAVSSHAILCVCPSLPHVTPGLEGSISL